MVQQGPRACSGYCRGRGHAQGTAGVGGMLMVQQGSRACTWYWRGRGHAQGTAGVGGMCRVLQGSRTCSGYCRGRGHAQGTAGVEGMRRVEWGSSRGNSRGGAGVSCVIDSIPATYNTVQSPCLPATSHACTRPPPPPPPNHQDLADSKRVNANVQSVPNTATPLRRRRSLVRPPEAGAQHAAACLACRQQSEPCHAGQALSACLPQSCRRPLPQPMTTWPPCPHSRQWAPTPHEATCIPSPPWLPGPVHAGGHWLPVGHHCVAAVLAAAADGGVHAAARG